ncbi:MAG: hypothetical protein ACTS1X_10950 [Parasphingopyxis sp.]|uniref:hypothetical protein n=1 Tax=Parasphingopyxis sp. TaxID=1920299 RepID=UPI003FA16A4A
MNINLDAIRHGVSLPDLVSKLPKIPTASAVSGLIVAALILMTPNPWFEAFIVETGLPGLVSAAEPPLGARARIVFALIAAFVVTLGAWIALTAIVGRKLRTGTRFAMPDEAGEGSSLPRRAPSLRRADAHPDAPYRRPIMAENDLGTPLDLVTVAPDDASDAVDDFDVLDLGEVAEIVEDDPPSVAAGEPAATSPEEDAAAPAEAAEDVSDAPEPVFEIPLPRRDRAGFPDAPIEPAVDPEPVAQAAPTSDARTELADLVARLEAGLERKKTAKDRQGQAEARPVTENVMPHPQARRSDDHDAALRDALSALQQVAGKGG